MERKNTSKGRIETKDDQQNTSGNQQVYNEIFFVFLSKNSVVKNY